MSRSFKKVASSWIGGASAKKDKRNSNKRIRKNDKEILKHYEDDSLLSVHKRDGGSNWGWSTDGRIKMYATQKEILNNEFVADAYKKMIRK